MAGMQEHAQQKMAGMDWVKEVGKFKAKILKGLETFLQQS